MIVRILNEKQVSSLLTINELLPVIETALIKQGSGEVVCPERLHFPVGKGLNADKPGESLGTGLTMPAYIHGTNYYATKLVGFFKKNPKRDLPTITSQIVVNEAETGLPVAIMDGNRVTGIRTGCIGGLAARELALEPVDLGVIGAGTQARWQTRAIAAATDLRSVYVYSPSDSRIKCAEDLNAELDAHVIAVDSAKKAVEGATTVVTATPAESPVIDGDWLNQGTTVIAVGAFSPEMQEIDSNSFRRASQVFADVPEEAVETGDVIATGLEQKDIGSLADVISGTTGREYAREIIIVESVGSAIFDAATAAHILQKADAKDIGTVVDL